MAESTARHEQYMKQALEMAETALSAGETPVGCVFVKGDEVIGAGMNDTNRSRNGTRHAELVAISDICTRQPASVIRECDLYVTVEPCIMCASALRQYGIRTVYFGCFNDRFGGTGGVLNIHSDEALNPPFPVVAGILREEAIMLLRRFYVQQNVKAPEPKVKHKRVLKTEVAPLSRAETGVDREHAGDG